jgi:molybdenum cofactor biosynthesis enzyme MoaA
MQDDFENVYDMIEHAIEYAFEGKMQLRFYEFLKYRKTTRAEIDAFLGSSTAKELASEVVELEEYIKGGRDSNHQQLREAYGHIPKPQARKIMNYLGTILDDAVRYSYDRRPGRRKNDSK